MYSPNQYAVKYCLNGSNQPFECLTEKFSCGIFLFYVHLIIRMILFNCLDAFKNFKWNFFYSLFSHSNGKFKHSNDKCFDKIIEHMASQTLMSLKTHHNPFLLQPSTIPFNRTPSPLIQILNIILKF